MVPLNYSPASGETLCLGCSYSVTKPSTQLSYSDLLQSTTQSKPSECMSPGQQHQDIVLPQSNGLCPRHRTSDLGKGFDHWAPGSQLGAGLQQRGWQGAAHLPGAAFCLRAAARLGIAFAFARVLKNNPLACQGYKQRENKLLSELIKLLSVAAHPVLTVQLGQAGV